MGRPRRRRGRPHVGQDLVRWDFHHGVEPAGDGDHEGESALAPIEAHLPVADDVAGKRQAAEWSWTLAGAGTLPSAVTLPASAGRHEMLICSCCPSLPK